MGANFSKKELLVRVISALILLPIVLFALFKSSYYFNGLLIIASLLMFREWTKITMSGSQGLSFVKWELIGLTYIVISIFSFSFIREIQNGEWWVLWTFLMVWSMDVGGYFAGKMIGGPKLLPRISPKKTWAGLIGGIIVALLINVYIFDIVPLISNYQMTIPEPVWWSAALIAALSQVGDLLESSFKRHFGVKDAGGLIPGHGGLLDRVDGLLIVSPFIAVWLNYFG